MSETADLLELAHRVRLLDDDTALLDGSKLTLGSAPPLADESGVVEGEVATPVATNRRASPSVSWLAMQLYGHCYVRPTPRSRATADTAVVTMAMSAVALLKRSIG